MNTLNKHQKKSLQILDFSSNNSEFSNFLTKTKSKMKKPILMTALVGFAVICFAFMPDKKPWNAPAGDAAKANAVKSSPESISDGKALYAKHCQSCHGKAGLGDGTKASELKTEPGDFSKAAFQGQSDGSLFYKISEGRDDMPSFKKKITDPKDIWNVVNYVRTLKK
jgi:mono/diheme cytochrome c family protein